MAPSCLQYASHRLETVDSHQISDHQSNNIDMHLFSELFIWPDRAAFELMTRDMAPDGVLRGNDDRCGEWSGLQIPTKVYSSLTIQASPFQRGLSIHLFSVESEMAAFGTDRDVSGRDARLERESHLSKGQ
eukprot:Blabericola_migrator_1__7714@NODE_393_length_9011_cov_44_629360_g313_i0_p4_GENE_NODE_393_length_9011_cov_44_629360_g313_i0NODE_393_length_9011_cov_44_629360_g313_i0_p4_ORF_typecomplete_len131_score15_57_NODE_393_length_9011_cov_44_629360_g313_i055375929